MTLVSPSEVRSPPRVLASALGVSLAGGAAIGLALAAAIAWLNDWGFGGDALRLAVTLGALYSALNAVGLGATALLLLAVGGRPGARVFLALLVGFYVFLSGVLRYNPAIQLFSVVPSMNAIGVIDLVGVALIAVVLAGAVLSATRRRQAAALVVAALLWAGLQVLNLWHERPRERDLAKAVPAALARTEAVRTTPSPEPFAGARLLVLGYDGLDWEVLLPLLRRGDLPNFHALLEDAAYGYLETLPFTISPVLWETISTGQPPKRHGIGHHVHWEIPGVSRRVRHLPSFRLCNTPLGVRRLLRATAPFAPWKAHTASSADARAARFWEIASRSALRVGVYGWQNTAPATPIEGFLHAKGSLAPLDFPAELHEGAPPLPPRPTGKLASGTGWPRAQADYERARWRRFVTLALRHRPEVLLFYTHFGDGVNHLNWKPETVGDGLWYAGLHRPELAPGPAMRLASALLDDLLADALARLPADATLVIVSDHGFEFRGYEHDNAPPGVLILHGAGIQPGVLRGASLYDVTPTLLHLLGLPVGDDMAGRPLAVAAPGGPLDRPPRRIASWGEALRPAAVDALDGGKRERELEYLRSLGYVVD